jgi:D-alanyl-lipoteichoic acid acyltransferase DltB (MBOAT superfamily)
VPAYIFVLITAILIDYSAGIFIQKTQSKTTKKLWLILSIITTCLLLFVFKYYNFFVGNFNGFLGMLGSDKKMSYWHILLPIGLSFHTFQSLSYVIEVYRGNVFAEKNFLIYSLYVLFYPQLVAGPIERPQNIIPQLHEKKKFDWNNIFFGLRLMIWGMFKKVVIADNLSVFSDMIFSKYADYSGASLYIGAFFFTIQIYCDFSGYSDIARGAAKTMGYSLMENFNLPYMATSLKDFWARWHISLSTGLEIIFIFH